MRSRTRNLAIGLSVLVTSAAGAQDLARGQIIDEVRCAADATETYALYLPAGYTRDRAWPVLFGFHPAARGRAIVEKYRHAADTYGYIVIASNTSRNGPWSVSEKAVKALWREAGERFAVDPRRIYATGHSGGARVALHLALGTNGVAGVIASSAGYPDSKPRSSLPFVVFGTAGTDDFNYIEMRLLERPLKTPHRIVIFPGGHTLPPDDVAMDAVEWLELEGMKSGARPKDEDLVERLWRKRHDAVTAAGESAAAVRLLTAIAEDFKGLREVKADLDRANALGRLPAIKRALNDEREVDDREIRLVEEFGTLEAGLRTSETRQDSLFGLQRLLADLSRKAAAATDSPVRSSARRLLRIVTAGADQRVQDPAYLKLLQQYRVVK